MLEEITGYESSVLFEFFFVKILIGQLKKLIS